MLCGGNVTVILYCLGLLIYDWLVIRETGTTSKPKKIQTNRQ